VVEAVGEGLACAAVCGELVAGALVLVTVAGTGALVWAIAHSNGTLTAQQPDRCGADPNTGAVTACALPSPQHPASPQRASAPPAQQAVAAQPPAPHVTGWHLSWNTRSWSTVTKWWDDTYLYARTGHWAYTTYTKNWYWSNGNVTTDVWTRSTHTWATVRQLLMDASPPPPLPVRLAKGHDSLCGNPRLSSVTRAAMTSRSSCMKDAWLSLNDWGDWRPVRR
jgi:hypothetical protein